MAGTQAERDGVLRAAAGLFAAQRRYPGTKLHVTLRKAFGFGSSAMAMNPFDHQTLTLAFPGVLLGRDAGRERRPGGGPVARRAGRGRDPPGRRPLPDGPHHGLRRRHRPPGPPQRAARRLGRLAAARRRADHVGDVGDDADRRRGRQRAATSAGRRWSRTRRAGPPRSNVRTVGGGSSGSPMARPSWPASSRVAARSSAPPMPRVMRTVSKSSPVSSRTRSRAIAVERGDHDGPGERPGPEHRHGGVDHAEVGVVALLGRDRT